MENVKKLKLQNDINVFGTQVKRFPEGIKEVFDSLVKMLPGGSNRSYFGVSNLAEDGKMIYTAAAEESVAGEAEKYKCERLTIEKGEYLTITVWNWREKTDTINHMFHQIMKDERVNKTKPAVEWYKNDDEMLCMVKSLE